MKALIDQLVRFYSDKGPVVLLESQFHTHQASRFSYVAAAPEATIKARGQQIEVVEDGRVSKFEKDPWQALTDFYKERDDYLFGYLGYDLKNYTGPLESKNRDNIEAPDLFFIVPSLLVEIDHQQSRAEAVKGDYQNVKAVSHGERDVSVSNITGSISKDVYISKIKNIQRDIYEGEYYELNFTRQLRGEFSGTPYSLYRNMRQAGSVPFGAYISFDDLHICCASPERFLHKTGKTVFSQPIKGTMKRNPDKRKDEKLKQKLLHSSKNRTENLMTVDLVRNDLSRIARAGSVEVEKLCDIQTFSTVHQMVSTVTAVAAEEDPVEIIKACFPMGSMTGAPKVRVMKRIEALENYRRGIYSGAIGYLTPGGNFDFNVVIRTAVIKQNELYYAVGGAITADSDPNEEWQETRLKAEALKKSVDKNTVPE